MRHCGSVRVLSNGHARLQGVRKRKRLIELGGRWRFYRPASGGCASDPAGAYCILVGFHHTSLIVWSVAAAAPVAKAAGILTAGMTLLTWLPGPGPRLFCFQCSVSGQASPRVRVLTPQLGVVTGGDARDTDRFRSGWLSVSGCGLFVAVTDWAHMLIVRTSDCSVLALLNRPDVGLSIERLQYGPGSRQLLVTAFDRFSGRQQHLLVDLTSSQTWLRLALSDVPEGALILGWGRQGLLCTASSAHAAIQTLGSLGHLPCRPCQLSHADCRVQPTCAASQDHSYLAVAVPVYGSGHRWRVAVVTCSTGRLAAEWTTPPLADNAWHGSLMLRWAQNCARLECRLTCRPVYQAVVDFG